MACRFAPSPTGVMHMGNIRTAIFNYLFAKTKKIPFYLRIEDTDENRSSKKYEDMILFICDYLNITFDNFNNKPFLRQSDNIKEHVKYAHKLVEKQYAFFCICDKLPEKFQRCDCRNQKYTQGVIRFKVPNSGSTIFEDVNYGKIVTPNVNIEDFALVRSNGTPTYMLSVVIDDHLMDISHVLRGDDHRNNSPKQILLYRALNWKEPTFVHLPLIVGQDGKKLSKRSKETNILDWINEGYTAAGIFNYLLKLGFGYGNEEKITMERALEIFSLTRLKKSPSMANISKLKHLSSYYLKTQSIHKGKISSLVIQKYPHFNLDLFDIIYQDVVPRSYSYQTFIDHLKFMEPYILNKDLLDKFSPIVLERLLKNIEKITNWNLENIREVFTDLDKSSASQNLRLALTNQDHSIGVLYVLLLLGKQESLNRIMEVIIQLKNMN